MISVEEPSSDAEIEGILICPNLLIQLHKPGRVEVGEGDIRLFMVEVWIADSLEVWPPTLTLRSIPPPGFSIHIVEEVGVLGAKLIGNRTIL